MMSHALLKFNKAGEAIAYDDLPIKHGGFSGSQIVTKHQRLYLDYPHHITIFVGQSLPSHDTSPKNHVDKHPLITP